MNLEEKNSNEIETFLKSKGAQIVGFASLENIKNVLAASADAFPEVA